MTSPRAEIVEARTSDPSDACAKYQTTEAAPNAQVATWGVFRFP
jgi:hypothetical protein